MLRGPTALNLGPDSEISKDSPLSSIYPSPTHSPSYQFTLAPQQGPTSIFKRLNKIDPGICKS